MPDHYGSKGYQQNVALGDMEFAQAVAPYLRPEYRHLIDPKAAKLGPALGKKIGLNTRRMQPWERAFHSGYPVTGGKVYAFGAENARHDAVWDEGENRKADIRQAFLMGDPRWMRETTDLWRQWMYRRDNEVPSKEATLAEIAKILAAKGSTKGKK